MQVALGYFEDCPNWRVAYERLARALSLTGNGDVVIARVRVTTEEQALELAFAGSPTILVDGVDPFAEERPRSGMSCRLYSTPAGVEGAPQVEQLVASLNAAR